MFGLSALGTGLVCAAITLAVLVGGTWVVQNWSSIKSYLPFGGGGSNTIPDPIAMLKTLLTTTDVAVLQSTEVRGVCNLALGGIDKVVETFDNDADKTAAKVHIQALASLLVVAPAPAAKV